MVDGLKEVFVGWLIVLLMVGIELQSRDVWMVWSFSCIRLGPFGVFDIGRCRVDCTWWGG
jgi:hypothetical protein